MRQILVSMPFGIRVIRCMTGGVEFDSGPKYETKRIAENKQKAMRCLYSDNFAIEVTETTVRLVSRSVGLRASHSDRVTRRK